MNVMDAIAMDKKYPVVLKKYLDEYVISQEIYKVQFVMSLYKYLHGMRTVFMVIGQTGSGKTHLIRTFANGDIRPRDFIVYVVDVSAVTSSGFTGDNWEDIARGYEIAAKGLPGSVYKKYGMVYMDEFDKICFPQYDNGGANVSVPVQHQVMKYLEGNAPDGAKNSGIYNAMMVLGGAFNQYFDVEKKKENVVGFMHKEDSVLCEEDNIRRTLLEIGVQPELLGRIRNIVKINSLGKKDLLTILTHPQSGIIQEKTKELQQEGISFEMDAKAQNALIDKVVEEKLGARAIRNIVNEMTIKAEYECFCDGRANTIVIDESAIRSSGVAKIEKRNRSFSILSSEVSSSKSVFANNEGKTTL